MTAVTLPNATVYLDYYAEGNYKCRVMEVTEAGVRIQKEKTERGAMFTEVIRWCEWEGRLVKPHISACGTGGTGDEEGDDSSVMALDFDIRLPCACRPVPHGRMYTLASSPAPAAPSYTAVDTLASSPAPPASAPATTPFSLPDTSCRRCLNTWDAQAYSSRGARRRLLRGNRAPVPRRGSDTGEQAGLVLAPNRRASRRSALQNRV